MELVQKILAQDINIKSTPNTKILKKINLDCMNIREISRNLKIIKNNYFIDSNKNHENINLNNSNIIFINSDYSIEIFLYKQISKEKIFCEIYINKLLICLNFLMNYLSKETKKQQKKEFCGNLIEELIFLFNP